MPSVPERELSILECIDRWKQFAINEVDNLTAFRECPTEYFSYGPWTASERELRIWRFMGDTELITSWVIARHGNLDPSPVARIYEALAIWFDAKSADDLPSDSLLKALLERSIIVVNSIINVIHPYTNPNRERDEKPKEAIEAFDLSKFKDILLASETYGGNWFKAKDIWGKINKTSTSPDQKFYERMRLAVNAGFLESSRAKNKGYRRTAKPFTL